MKNKYFKPFAVMVLTGALMFGGGVATGHITSACISSVVNTE